MPVETAQDLASFFNDDEFAAAASYVPPGGGPGTPCTILVDKREADAHPGQGRPLAGQVSLQVRAAQIAAPAKDGTFAVPAQPTHPAARTYTVMDRPLPADPDVSIWTMWAR